MTFKELLLQLHEVKKEAQKLGLNSNQIANLKIIDIGIMNSIVKKKYDIGLAKDKFEYYVFFKEKK